MHPALLAQQLEPGTIVVIVDAAIGGPELARRLDERADGAAPVQLDDDQLAAVAGVGRRLLTTTVGTVLVGALPNSRPLASALARLVGAGDTPASITFVCVGNGETVAARDVYVAGVLVRLLLEECDAALVLSEAAGIAVSIASTFSDDASALGGASLAVERDIFGAVPQLALALDADETVVATAL